MAQRHPYVRDGRLYPQPAEGLPTIALGSAAWHAWLEEHTAFRVEAPFVRFTARKEQRAGGCYWYAYRRQQGILQSAYLGKSEDLTPERLCIGTDALQRPNDPVTKPRIRALPGTTARTPAPARPTGPPPEPGAGRSLALPSPLTALIGRAQDATDVAALLRRADVRLVTLLGIGGVGKTRLALQVAANLRADFADGVYFVPLATIRDPQLVPAAVAQILGLSEDGPEAGAARLTAGLAGQQLLLVLDNFEQVMPAAALLVDLLVRCPGLKLLVTSREILHLQGEYHFVVAPLAYPDPADRVPPATLAQYPAVDLFIQRAQAIVPHLALDPATLQAIGAICAYLDGLPLAIELATAYITLFPPPALLPRLGQRLAFLTRGGPDLPARQRALRATFAWSYDLLTAEEQRIFRRLAVFSGGCTLEAAEAVCTRAGDVPAPLSAVVAALIDKSLLQPVDLQTSGPRLQMLATVREYAWECLTTSGELERLQEAHAAYYLAFAEAAEPELYRQQQYEWLDRLEREDENLRVALTFLVSRPDREQAARLAGALGWSWYMRGRLSEGRHWIAQILPEPAPAGWEATDRKALFAGGLFAVYLDQHAQARAWLAESRALCAVLGDIRGFVQASRMLVYLFLLDGDREPAQLQAAETAALAQWIRDPWTLAVVRSLCGALAMYQGDFAQAQRHYEQAVALLAEAGDLHTRAQMLLLVADALLAQGKAAQAEQLIEDPIREAATGRSSQMASWVLCSYGETALRWGQGARARVLLEQSVALFQRLGDRPGLAHASALLAQVALSEQDTATAQHLALQALQLARAERGPDTIIACLTGLARIAAAQGRAHWAARLWGAAARQREATRLASAQLEAVNDQPLLEQVRQYLGGEAFITAQTEGRAMSPEQAVTAPTMITPALEQTAADAHSLPAPALGTRPAGLTPRELEVLLLVAEGCSNQQIAARLVVSLPTVKTYLSAIYKKLGVASRTAAMRYVIEQHLQESPRPAPTPPLSPR